MKIENQELTVNQKILKLKLLSDCMLLSCQVHVQSESTLYSCLNVKELLARNSRDI